MEMNRVDEEYENKMVAFEVDCNDGKGELSACHHVGEFYSVVKDDHVRAAKTYTLNCEQKGYGPSCFNLGRLYLGGKGVEQSDDKALALFAKACTTKHLQGCHHEAMLLYMQANSLEKAKPNEPKLSPEIIQKKKLEAVNKFDWSCNAGELESCYYAGSHYLDLKQPDRDPKKAMEYFTKACHVNHAPSCYNLAVMFKKGDTNISKDEKEFEKYKDRTNELIKMYGSFGGTRTG